MSERYDLVVIGGGPAAERGAAQAAYFGKRVAVVERQPTPGGAAVHTGTLPSKTLRETLFLSGYRQRDLYGVTIDVDPDLTIRRLLERKDTVRDLEIERIHGTSPRTTSVCSAARAGSWTHTRSRWTDPTGRAPSTPTWCWWPPDRRRTVRRASRTTIPTSTTPTGSCGSSGCPDRSP